MLHTFFFILYFLMDYNAVTDALRGGFMLGLINACLVWVAVAWLSFRGRMGAENRQTSSRSRFQ